MGMDYLVCNLCNGAFTDYHAYGNCATCEEVMCESCLDDMITKYGQVDKESEFAGDYGEYNSKNCDICTGVQIQETEFVKFLVKRIGETRAALEDAFRSSLKS